MFLYCFYNFGYIVELRIHVTDMITSRQNFAYISVHEFVHMSLNVCHTVYFQ